jgi:hypothetical protein
MPLIPYFDFMLCRKTLILLVLVTWTSQLVLAQTSTVPAIKGKSLTELKKERVRMDTNFDFVSVFSNIKQPPAPTDIRRELLQLSNDQRVYHYGIFCKWEEKIQHVSKIPLKFRLGSLDYVNYLEKKNEPSHFYRDTRH